MWILKEQCLISCLIFNMTSFEQTKLFIENLNLIINKYSHIWKLNLRSASRKQSQSPDSHDSERCKRFLLHCVQMRALMTLIDHFVIFLEQLPLQIWIGCLNKLYLPNGNRLSRVAFTILRQPVYNVMLFSHKVRMFLTRSKICEPSFYVTSSVLNPK